MSSGSARKRVEPATTDLGVSTDGDRRNRKAYLVAITSHARASDERSFQMTDIDSLNLGDLDVEALERRLEMVEPATAEGYYCNSDCTDHGYTAPQPVVPG